MEETTTKTTSKKFSLDEKVTVLNIAPWTVMYSTDKNGVSIEANQRIRLRRDEIVEQVSARNRLFVGLDDYGSHATLIIEDEDTRKYLEFDSQDGKRRQNVLSKEKVKDWFAIKNQNEFQNTIIENVVTRAEKRYLMTLIKELKLDSYEKIRFCEIHCKFTLRTSY